MTSGGTLSFDGKPSGAMRGQGLRLQSQARISASALWRALRCATSTGMPALLGAITGNGDFGWAALGGFEATLADAGGAYQARFTAMGLLSIGGGCGLFLGMMSQHQTSGQPIRVLWHCNRCNQSLWRTYATESVRERRTRFH